jgi:hypothetical protein
LPSRFEFQRSAMPSTAIRNLFYVPAKRELWVTFVTGRRYVYADVPVDIFDAFKTASSRGAFFNHEIRDRYAFREVTHRRPVKPRAMRLPKLKSTVPDAESSVR